jgi:hypothetical protein
MHFPAGKKLWALNDTDERRPLTVKKSVPVDWFKENKTKKPIGYQEAITVSGEDSAPLL